jgi:hypothetical protein
METQPELFETNQTAWVQEVWRSIPTTVRQEITAVLAQMASAAIGAAQRVKGGSNE